MSDNHYTFTSYSLTDMIPLDDINFLYNLCNEQDSSFFFYIEEESDTTAVNHALPYLYLCCDKNTLIGVLSLCIDIPSESEDLSSDKGSCVIYGFTHPAYRGKHIFTELYRRAYDMLKQNNIYHLAFHIPDSEVPLSENTSTVLHFLSHHGYTKSHHEYLLSRDLTHSLDSGSFYGDFPDISIPDCEFDDTENEFTLWLDDTYIGGCFIYFSEDNNTATIYGYEIRDSYRGQGYGKLGLYLILKELQQLECDKVILHVTGKNKIAHNLYISCGFQTNSSFTVYSLDVTLENTATGNN